MIQLTPPELECQYITISKQYTNQLCCSTLQKYEMGGTVYAATRTAKNAIVLKHCIQDSQLHWRHLNITLFLFRA